MSLGGKQHIFSPQLSDIVFIFCHSVLPVVNFNFNLIFFLVFYHGSTVCGSEGCYQIEAKGRGRIFGKF